MTRNYRNFLTTICALAILLTISLGCRQLANLRERRSRDSNDTNYPTSTPGGGRGQTTETKGGLNEKTNLYIGKCFNQYSNRVMDSYRRYASWQKDVKKGPTGKERIIYGLYDVSGDGEDCASAVNQAKEMEPDMPKTEEIADQYVVALKEAISQIRNVYKYYDQEDYKDDNFQKGKESHAALVEAFDKFETVNKDFALEIDNLENEVAQKQLEEYKNDPSKKFAYSVVDFNIKAKKISVYAQRTDYDQMKADELQTMNDELEAALSEMKTQGSGNTFGSMYFSAGDEFLKASKELMRRLRDKKPFNSFERDQLGTFSGWMVEGSPDKVIHKYNDLIQRRSMLRLGS